MSVQQEETAESRGFMATMRVAQVSGPKAKFEIVERPIPPAGPETVRIKVAACGVCHSDSLVKEGLWPGLQYPRVPGHEVAGTIDAVGRGSDRVGARPTRRGRLARRILRTVRAMPAREPVCVRDAAGDRHQLRRGLRRVHDRPGQRRRTLSRRSVARRCRAAPVRRSDHVQRLAQFWRRARAM